MNEVSSSNTESKNILNETQKIISNNQLSEVSVKLENLSIPIQTETEHKPFQCSKQTIEDINKDLNQNGKRNLKQKFNNKRLHKKQKVVKCPIYQEGVQPAQLLNEIHPGFLHTFDIDNTNLPKIKYICNIEINIKDSDTEQIKTYNFKAEGMSKKEAKKICCNKALISLYGDSYKPPEDFLNQSLEKNSSILDDSIKKYLSRLNEFRKRIDKLTNKTSILMKSPSQILHELSAKISAGGKFIQENTQIPEQRFCFQIENLAEEAIITPNTNEPHTVTAYGFGKNKKEAKNNAAKQALKQFYEYDLDKIINESIKVDKSN